MASDARLLRVIQAVAPRHRNLVTLACAVRDRVRPDLIEDTPAALAYVADPASKWLACIAYATELIWSEPDGPGWGERAVTVLLDNAECYNVTKKQLTQALRVFLTGSVVSEPLEAVLNNIGRPVVLAMLRTIPYPP